LQSRQQASCKDRHPAARRYVEGKTLRNPDTVVNHFFQGQLLSQIKCQRCQDESSTYDPFMDLSLEIEGCASLEEVLQHFTQVGAGTGVGAATAWASARTCPLGGRWARGRCWAGLVPSASGAGAPWPPLCTGALARHHHPACLLQPAARAPGGATRRVGALLPT
jgi:hypothetical protein